MSTWEKSLREHKPRKHPKNPSFSTILLDEMFRSIDDGEEEKFGRKNNGKMCSFEDEELASLKRAYLMEKLMEKKIKDKVISSSNRKTSSSLPDMEMYGNGNYNDPIFFSTTSSSSSESSSGGLSSSDAEFYGSAKSTVSCFYASKPKNKPNPKPSKKSSSSSSNVVPPRPRKSQNQSYYEQQSECHLFDDYHYHQQKNGGDEDLIKSKSRAMKIYSNLVKVKQPISPGGKFTSFLNSLFTNGNGKKNKKINNMNNGYEEKLSTSGGLTTTCSSASSFSRSCLSKSAPSRTTKIDDNLNSVVKRSVRFYPDSVVSHEDSRSCGENYVYGRQYFSEKNVAGVKNKKDVLDEKRDYLMKEKILRKNADYYDDEDFDDGISDSSSDLFEIDHLALLGDERFCEELPVYETTHLDRNRAIACGMIC